MTIHKTVLLDETIEALNLKPGMVVVDATLGGGGHSREILKKIGSNGELIAIDADVQAVDKFAEFLISNLKFPNKPQAINDQPRIDEQSSLRVEAGKIQKIGNIFLINENFASLKNILVDLKIEKIDAIVADLGISSDQLQDSNRGISFQNDAPLDMRMDMTKGQTAADILNTYDEQELVRILKEFGDERHARTIARNIASERKKNQILRTSQLVSIIERSVSGEYKRKKIHFATKTFQALRIEVNRELESLSSFLSQAVELLESSCRLAIITFHSGEDALVKYKFRENARGCICPPEFPVCQCGRKPVIKLITHKPIVPSENEVEENPRSRSAKLRVIEKI
ncbi:MAG TPA: 16S rRNA (cytosine(1402)-N(4))-methyltransferase RsmH [Candidatus Moranbacteria bacterium]|nr:16S rRNA (cytosine(1402)-N(4))-methyltransferase RsmH [Candidatus Moranbacteria bacterium]HRY27700.1 16S rRNA (cytosine(1402)-N(4))-methyltransferase RsmH [Candidatus Moranbacteria bacterium]HSA07977.1 16S rRNA (cytosine(1402)-N(4))-methyltransferase RsmH [Candidatus Moranbacteria bacterium]